MTSLWVVVGVLAWAVGLLVLLAAELAPWRPGEVLEVLCWPVSLPLGLALRARRRRRRSR